MQFGYLTSAFSRKKKINLALQGGGAHGSFTWGVLDRLLNCDDLHIDGISGTSAGAVNAVALAAGMMEGGRRGAKEKLNTIWKDIANAGTVTSMLTFPIGMLWPSQVTNVAQQAMQRFAQTLSPYDFNPMDINPLRTILNKAINFEELRKNSPTQLFIATTNASSGRARIFTNKDITADAVLASACLPALFKAVEIDGEYYWDGGYSSNPDLINLISETSTNDTLLIQLNPTSRHNLPTTQEEIVENINRITFNQPLIHEIELIYRVRKYKNILSASHEERRYHNTRFHLINASHITKNLDYNSKLTPDKEILKYLFSAGQKETGIWVDKHLHNVGKRSTVNLLEEFS